MHVFLSYSRRDALFVGRLADDLTSRGIDPWLDTDDLPTDDEDRWRRSVVQGIRESDAIVLVLSPDAVESAAVERELTIGAEMGRRIIPIVHRTCELSDGVMFELAGLQRTDFVDLPYEVAFDQLVRRIHAEQPTAAGMHPPPLGARGDRRDTAVDPVRADPGRRGNGHLAVTAVASQASDRSGTRRRTWPVVAAVVSVVVILALVGVSRLRDGGAERNDVGALAPTEADPAVVVTDPSEDAVPGDGSEAPSVSVVERSVLVPWDEAGATFERRDGTTALVAATSVGLACDRGDLQFKDGQTVSLERVESIRFEAINLANSSADGLVVLLDGRELDAPIHTWNCPVVGTTDLGPLEIQLEDIRRIDFHR